MIDTCQHIAETTIYNKIQIDSLLRAQDGKMDSILTNLSSIMTEGTDYTPEIKVFAIPLIIAIFTIMGSLIFAIISRIDSKYSARQFVKLFWKHWSIVSFIICSIICLIMIIAYAVFRKHTESFNWSMILCSLAILQFVLAVFIFIRALRFNNPLKLLSLVFSKYKCGLCNDTQLFEFYSLCSHLTHYAIVYDITLLHYFVNKFTGEHLQKAPDYKEDLYKAIIEIASDYKEKEEDTEVNDALAFLFASLIDATPNGYTQQDTYNALFQVMYICNRNKHYSLINGFQRRMRYAYYCIAKNAQNDRNERANRLQIFVLTLNGLLYGKGTTRCVDDAINNNYDAIIIGNAIVIPATSNQCFDLYLYLRELLMDGKEFAHYSYVASDLTSYSNVTLLNRYIAAYFAYLITKLHLSELSTEDLILSPYIIESKIKDGVQALIKNAPNDAAKSHIQKLDNDFWRCRKELINGLQINQILCESVISQRMGKMNLIANAFPGIATNNPVYMSQATDLIQPSMELYGVPRIWLSDKCLIGGISFYEKGDFGSRTIECIMDTLATVYNSFERAEEVIHRKDLRKWWLKFVGKYDYSFLTFNVGIPNRVIPFGEKFSSYFPSKSVIVIRIPDLPYIEWNKDCQILSIEDDIGNEAASPKVNIKVDLHMKIHYRKSTIIHVLKVIE